MLVRAKLARHVRQARFQYFNLPVSDDANLPDRGLSSPHVAEPECFFGFRRCAHGLEHFRRKFSIHSAMVLRSQFFCLVTL